MHQSTFPTAPINEKLSEHKYKSQRLFGDILTDVPSFKNVHNHNHSQTHQQSMTCAQCGQAIGAQSAREGIKCSLLCHVCAGARGIWCKAEAMRNGASETDLRTLNHLVLTKPRRVMYITAEALVLGRRRSAALEKSKREKTAKLQAAALSRRKELPVEMQQYSEQLKQFVLQDYLSIETLTPKMSAIALVQRCMVASVAHQLSVNALQIINKASDASVQIMNYMLVNNISVSSRDHSKYRYVTDTLMRKHTLMQKVAEDNTGRINSFLTYEEQRNLSAAIPRCGLWSANQLCSLRTMVVWWCINRDCCPPASVHLHTQNTIRLWCGELIRCYFAYNRICKQFTKSCTQREDYYKSFQFIVTPSLRAAIDSCTQNT